MFTPRRITTDELLDEHDAPAADVERSLRDLRRINRWLGGVGIYRRMVRHLAGTDGRLAILDLGTATSDLLQSLRGDHIRVGLDFKIDHLTYGRVERPHVFRVVGDAKRLPFLDNAVDVVTSAHFFHHFSPDENVGLLDESLRVARIGVAVNDTERHYVPLSVVRLLSLLRLVGRITRYDAPASVLQGYTHREARAVAARTRADRWKVVAFWPYRFGMILWK
ncbi:MAG: methyltransferase domain-containing protein [Thermoanaerobaculia bacterium]